MLSMCSRNELVGCELLLSRYVVILTLMVSERFRWVYCQLDTLRRCFPSSIRKTLKELPETLDETYERMLGGIPKEKRQHAHRLFQCLVAAIRPLYVEELAEIFAIEFDQDATRNLMEGWRPENPQEAVLSACSTLITVIDNNKGSKIVQFSHFSVKEFLTSDRLRTSEVGNICLYHIPLNAAHTILAQACLTVMLQLDEKIDKKRLATFPLAFYAAQHWFAHVKYEDVEPRVQDAMEELFNPTKPYLASWVWIHDVDEDEDRKTIDRLPDHPSVPEATSLYYAMISCGLCGLAKYLISTHGEDVNAKCGYHGTPLHAALYGGHHDAVSLLLDHGADVNITNEQGRPPLFAAYHGRHLDIMRLLLERGAALDVKYDSTGLLIHHVSCIGQAEEIRLLLQHKADVNAISWDNWTPLHWAFDRANAAQILLDHGADINAISASGKTPLFYASKHGCLEVVRLLLARGADVHIRTEDGETAFQVATSNNRTHVAQLLLEHGAEEE
jgi:ankyrin repeat protein